MVLVCGFRLLLVLQKSEWMLYLQASEKVSKRVFWKESEGEKSTK